MTNITVYAYEDGRLHGYMASGHAGGKKVRGYDLVCCAVSVLTQTAVNALESITGKAPVVSVQDGFLRCYLPEGLDDRQMDQAQTILATIMQGLTDIQKIYPTLVRIQHREWRQADAYDESSALRS